MQITSRYYAGIDSRETPLEILTFFSKLGGFLAAHKFILRSGGATGADKAFEDGCNRARGDKEIYLPWRGFEGSQSSLIVSDPKAFEVAATYHPYWDKLSDGARKLQARNSHQVLGLDLNTPSEFIICWTKNGKGSGGTGQAIRIANAYDIPVCDVGRCSDLDEVKAETKKFLSEFIPILK